MLDRRGGGVLCLISGLLCEGQSKDLSLRNMGWFFRVWFAV